MKAAGKTQKSGNMEEEEGEKTMTASHSSIRATILDSVLLGSTGLHCFFFIEYLFIFLEIHPTIYIYFLHHNRDSNQLTQSFDPQKSSASLWAYIYMLYQLELGGRA